MKYIELFEDNIDFYKEEISKFFSDNIDHAKLFHPHKLDWGELKRILFSKSKDCYLLMFDNNEVVGYGMLRGWDEGFDIPSLGLLIDLKNRGKGMGSMLLNKLAAIAKEKEAKKIIVNVYIINTASLNLLNKNGYIFSPSKKATDVLEGFKVL